MKIKRIAALALSLALIASAVFALPAFASVFTFETQYEYKSADPAWLTDLVIKEDLNDLSATLGRCTLIAQADYPYTETAASFRSEVEQFCELYSLKESTMKASSVYFIELLGANSSVFAAQATDTQVRTYLENEGVVYPESPSTDVNLLAKALYTAMVAGTFKDLDANAYAGMQLEKALTAFVVRMSGFSEKDLADWIPGGTLASLEDYTLAVSRMTLWSSGYEVTAETPADEVYKLMAVMTIRNLGISVDPSVSFEELKGIYTAALLGKKYDITLDPDRLTEAQKNNEAAFYVLKLIGQKQGLTVRAENGSFEDAFLFVASHTDLFDIEEDEFYADIYRYDIYLTAPRSSLWIYPTSYYGTVSPSHVKLRCNGLELKDNYFTQIAISPVQPVQTLTITVNCTAGDGAVREYVITVHSENAATQPEGSRPETTDPDATTFLSSNAIVSRILSAAGVDQGIITATDHLITALPVSVKDAISFITPTFNDDTVLPVFSDGLPDAAEASVGAESYILALDSVGAFLNSGISGINGIGLADKYTADTLSLNFITVN